MQQMFAARYIHKIYVLSPLHLFSAIHIDVGLLNSFPKIFNLLTQTNKQMQFKYLESIFQGIILLVTNHNELQSDNNLRLELVQ